MCLLGFWVLHRGWIEVSCEVIRLALVREDALGLALCF